MLISAAATIGVATLTQRVINDGLLKDDSGVVIETDIWMMVLGLVAAGALAGAAVFAVFFSEGTAYVIRSELYRHVQRLSFENGPHEQLTERKGLYYNLYMSQFRGKGTAGEDVDTSGFAST